MSATDETELVRLVALADLGESGVTTVETPHGKLAVGVSEGKPFAVSDRCRHLFASLGKGRIAEDGCLECPLHRARYDVRTGQMMRGPQGIAFAAARGVVRAAVNTGAPLRRYPVVERDGVLFLAG
jgi:nitrite reductase/ring-hydroxylating ferredoxin subunit